MPSCCRSNSSGRCLNCVYVKASNACTNCMPQRHGNCRNSITNRPNLRNSSGVASQATVLVQPLPSPTPLQQLEIQSGVSLPPFTPTADSRFAWGDVDADTFTHSIIAAYAEVVNWKHNVFSNPLGSIGKAFVSELARLFRAYAEGTALEAVAHRPWYVLPFFS